MSNDSLKQNIFGAKAVGTNIPPQSGLEMLQRIGSLHTLKDVQAAQARVAEWIVSAAEKHYGDALYERSLQEAHEVILEFARATWPDFEDLEEHLNRAEEDAFAKSEPMA